MPVFPKICKLLINSSMRFIKNECLTPHLTAFIMVFFLTLSGAAHADRSGTSKNQAVCFGFEIKAALKNAALPGGMDLLRLKPD